MIGLLAQILPVISQVLDKTLDSKESKGKILAGIETTLANNAYKINAEQIKTNTAEAQHRSIWVAGWRPAIGWSLALGIFWMVIGYPITAWYFAITGRTLDVPEIPTEILMELTLGMLGMAGIRSFDKIKGLTR